MHSHKLRAMRRMLFRPELGHASLPITARSVGEQQQGGRFRDQQPARHFVQVLWGLSGAGSVHLPGRAPVTLPAHHIAWIMPGEAIDLRSDEPWHYRWWTVDGPVAVDFVTGLDWPEERCRFAGPCPVGSFELLHTELPRPGRLRAATAIALQLLLAASGPADRESDDDLPERCQQLIATHAADPAIDVPWLAAELACHRATLTRRCAARWGYGPGEALRSWRRQRGLELLSTTSLSISEIATASGFADPAYFSREIKRATGCSPRALRGG